ELIRLCERTSHGVNDTTQTIGDSLEELREGILGIEINNAKSAPLHVAQVTDRALDEWDRLREQQADLVGSTTGIDSLDRATTGIRPGEFWVVGGSPGDGKSSVAITAALENAKREIPVGIFSLEMKRDQVLHRMWSQYGQITYA